MIDIFCFWDPHRRYIRLCNEGDHVIGHGINQPHGHSTGYVVGDVIDRAIDRAIHQRNNQLSYRHVLSWDALWHNDVNGACTHTRIQAFTCIFAWLQILT